MFEINPVDADRGAGSRLGEPVGECVSSGGPPLVFVCQDAVPLWDRTLEPGRLMSRADRVSKAGGAVFMNCPRCGLSIRRKVDRLMLEHCPRCAGRAGIPVPLFVSARPAVSWHRDGPAPYAEQVGSRGRGPEGPR